ncbi:MAG TPA: ice-binding family protein [Thermoanaerobaculia bacterium]|nr:ice-binding family protein [Thermoanaerobaculia bacterium]
MMDDFPGGRYKTPGAGRKGINMNRTHTRLLASFALATLVSLAFAATAQAQAVAPSLGTAGDYTVLGTNGVPTAGTVTCTTSTIDGNVGTTGNAITNTGPCTINGTIDAPVAGAVVNDFDNAYAALPTLNPVCDGDIPIITTTLAPGVYCSAAGTTIGAGVTITLDGGANDVWVFRVGTGGLGALTGTGPGFNVVMGGTAQACNVYWWTAEAATVTDSTFAGTVLAGTSATMTGTTWEGRALATDDVTLTDSIITGCAAAPARPEVAQIPTLGFVGMATLVALIAAIGLVALRKFS